MDGNKYTAEATTASNRRGRPVQIQLWMFPGWLLWSESDTRKKTGEETGRLASIISTSRPCFMSSSSEALRQQRRRIVNKSDLTHPPLPSPILVQQTNIQEMLQGPLFDRQTLEGPRRAGVRCRRLLRKGKFRVNLGVSALGCSCKENGEHL